jgi:hypothetical protein
MKKLLVCMALAGTVAACNPNDPTDRAIGGGLVGAGTGALVGGLATGRTGGALAGAAIGGVGGAIIGSATTPRDRRVYRRDVYRDDYRYRSGWCRGYDDFGNPVRVPC